MLIIVVPLWYWCTKNKFLKNAEGPLGGSWQCVKTKAIVEKQEMRVIETAMEKCYNMLERKEWI